MADGLEISVVVPCRDHAIELEDCLRAIGSQRISAQYEIIVVDSNGDPAVLRVADGFGQVRTVSGRNLLPGEARNLGARQARGRFLAFTDADCVPEEDWLEAAIRELRAGAEVVGGPVLDAYSFRPVAAMDNAFQFIDFAPQRPDGPAEHLPSCNLAIARDAFEQLGGFPADTPVGEDTIMTAAAAKLFPGRVRFARAMRVRHRGRRGIGAFWIHQLAFGFHRGRLGLRLSAFERRLGRHAVGAIAMSLKRVAYFWVRTVQWNRKGLLKLVLLTPLIAVGMTAWAIGLRRGCRSGAEP